MVYISCYAGAAEPVAVNDSAAAEHPRLEPECHRRGDRIRISGSHAPTASPAHAAGIGEPRLPRRETSGWCSQGQEPLNSERRRRVSSKLCVSAPSYSYSRSLDCRRPYSKRPNLHSGSRRIRIWIRWQIEWSEFVVVVECDVVVVCLRWRCRCDVILLLDTCGFASECAS